MKLAYLFLLLLMAPACLAQELDSLPLPHEGIFVVKASGDNSYALFYEGNLSLAGQTAPTLYYKAMKWVEFEAPSLIEQDYAFRPNATAGGGPAGMYGNRGKRRPTFIKYQSSDEKTATFHIYFHFYDDPEPNKSKELSGYHLMEMTLTCLDEEIVFYMEHLKLVRFIPDPTKPNAQTEREEFWPVMKSRTLYSKKGEKKPYYDRLRGQYLELRIEVNTMLRHLQGYLENFKE